MPNGSGPGSRSPPQIGRAAPPQAGRAWAERASSLASSCGGPTGDGGGKGLATGHEELQEGGGGAVEAGPTLQLLLKTVELLATDDTALSLSLRARPERE